MHILIAVMGYLITVFFGLGSYGKFVGAYFKTDKRRNMYLITAVFCFVYLLYIITGYLLAYT